MGLEYRVWGVAGSSVGRLDRETNERPGGPVDQKDVSFKVNTGGKGW
jgi:hypothetical protein